MEGGRGPMRPLDAALIETLRTDSTMEHRLATMLPLRACMKKEARPSTHPSMPIALEEEEEEEGR